MLCFVANYAKIFFIRFQLRELQVQIDVREEKIRELKLLHETGKETESKHMAVVTSLRAQLADYQAKTGDIEGLYIELCI